MWRLLLGTMGVKSLVQGLNAAATAGFEPRTVWSEVRRRNLKSRWHVQWEIMSVFADTELNLCRTLVTEVATLQNFVKLQYAVTRTGIWEGWETFRPLRGFFSLKKPLQWGFMRGFFSQTEEAPERAKRLWTFPYSRPCLMFWNKFFPLLNLQYAVMRTQRKKNGRRAHTS